MAVKFQPQGSVTQINLRPRRRARTRDGHRAQTGSRSGIRRVEAPGTLSELIAASKLTPTGAHGGREAGGRKNRAVMQRRRIPGAVGAAVHRPGLTPVREERARIGDVGARLAGRDEIAISAQFVDVVAARAGEVIVPAGDHRRTFPPVRRRCFIPGEGLTLSLIQQRVPTAQELLLLGFRPIHLLEVDVR